MGNRIVVMNEGVIVQTGTPQEVYNYPESMFVAGFVGAPKINFFASRLRKTDTGWAVMLFGNPIDIPAPRLPADQAGLIDGMKVILGIRPEEFQAAQPDSEVTVEATARKVVPMGAGLHVESYNGNQKFLTVLMNHTDVQPGDPLRLAVNPWCIHVFDPETEQNLCRPVYKEAE